MSDHFPEDTDYRQGPLRDPQVGERYEVQGRIRHVRYQSDDGLFMVADLDVEKGPRITVKGNLLGVEAEERLRIRGRWTRTRYGEQLQVDSYEPILPVTPEGIARYLAGQLPGVGPRLGRRIVDQFGADTVLILDAQPERLLEVEGIGAKKLQTIKTEWNARQGQRAAQLFLQSHNISTSLASRLIKQYGAEAVNVVRHDPYRLAREVHGVGFATADRIALELGFPRESPDRIDAGVTHVLDECENAYGHCFVSEPFLALQVATLLQVEQPLVEDAIGRLERTRSVIIEPVLDGNAVYSRRAWAAEVAIAARLRELADEEEGPCTDASGQIVQERQLVRRVEAAIGLELAIQQRRAVELALSRKVVVVTGGPGTGKTTLVRVMVEAFGKLGWPVSLAAPTGRAAKRLAEATGAEARTIHRLLEFSFQAGGFTRNAEEPLPTGAYIVDECSMIDIYLMRALVEALPQTARLILVGDVDQLPSVGPGTVLSDLIRSGALEVVRLTEVFRQASASLIVRNAHRINHGEMPVLPDVANGEPVDYFFIPAHNAAEAEWRVEEVVCERIPRSFKLDPSRDVQVLSPMRIREAGVEALNRRLQARLNPNGQPIRGGETPMRVGDRVMQLRNDYDKDVYNGDVGWVMGWLPGERRATIRFDERDVSYAIDELDDLALAYACTVHKAQGSEYQAVVVPVLRGHYRMLQRNLVYTALTRARRVAIFIGQVDAMRTAVENDQPATRNTRLAERLAGR